MATATTTRCLHQVKAHANNTVYKLLHNYYVKIRSRIINGLELANYSSSLKLAQILDV